MEFDYKSVPKPEIAVEVVQRIFPTVRVSAGSDQILVSCPFHRDRKPSCSISIRKCVYKCFSCQRGGTLAGMYWELTGRSIYKELGASCSPIRLGISDGAAEVEDYNKLPDVDFCVHGSYSDPFSNDKCAAYLRHRGISEEIARDMGMKYSFDCFTSPQVYDESDPDDRRNKISFFHRLLIPIREGGKMLSLEGRAIQTESEYLAENPKGVYKKCIYPKNASTKTLFQMDKLNKNEPLYFVEGLMDLAVLRSDPYFKNSTAIFGANITLRQVYFLKQFRELVYIIDNDLAGWTSAKSLYEKISREISGCRDFYILVPPLNYKDVGEMLDGTSESAERHPLVSIMRERRWLDSIMLASKTDFKPIIDRLAREKEIAKGGH